ncbi:MAG: sensor histidine kinase, partial [Anaerolineae bacterium]|nr:sensor histidine kinase [Anaerolineae bacterium]
FQEAMSGGLGRYFALGTTSLRRGYYFSYPVQRQGAILGVLVVKVDIATAEARQIPGQEELIVTDPAGVVFISSRP